MSTSLLQLLIDAAESFPDRELSAWRGRSYTFTALHDAAARAAGGLAEAGVRPATPVLILVADVSDFFPLFWGTLYAGATPVPLAGPRDLSEGELARVGRVMQLLEGPVVVDRGVRFPGVDLLDVGELLEGPALGHPVEGDAPALIQFSSGSTRAPRGVVLTHANLRANVDQLAAALPVHGHDLKLTWMPHFHDMGLIGCHLLPMRLGMAQVRMDPRDALGDPRDWLRAVSATRATVLTTTNAALARLNRYLDRGAPADIDLSSVRCLFNGAEPISPEVCARFCELTGLPDSIHLPMYGLAEATVGISSAVGGGIRTRPFDGREVVEIGPLLPGVEVRTVDDDGQELDPGGVGHLQVRGPNVTAGYWRDPEATEALFDGVWARTGDLGCVRDGTLLITGRHKDVICVGGRNLHAHDMEAEAEAVDGVRPGGAVAVADTRGPSEALALAVALDDAFVAAEVLWEVKRRVTARTAVEPSAVVPIERVPRTTSGKKRRAQVRTEIVGGDLDDALGNTVQRVRSVWEASLARPLDDDDLDTRFADLGGTSVMAQEILTRLEARLGFAGDHRILLAGETVRAMARFLEREGPFEGRVATVEPRGAGEPIAIVGAACRLPGADTAEAFWDDVTAGTVRLGPAPAGRFPAPFSDLVGGYLDDVATFDAARFGIDDAEAAVLDPQQRLMLTVAAEALDRAGSPTTHEVGVFVGAGHNAYLEHVLEHLDDDPHPGTMAGNLLNMIAARVAHSLDLRGPALSVDTACSASLVALHLASQSLQTGECELALAAGVNLLLTPTAHRLFRAAGALSPSGRCRPFEPDADGMVPGEGAIAFLLAPLSRARATGMPVLGVVRSVAVNNDGASLGAMAPNPAGQDAVIRRALDLAGVRADQVVFVEAHGTGTPIGDPVERSVLDRIHAHGPRIGTDKARTGHLLAAAGAAGLLRTLGEIRAGGIGAVSSFGFGGTNAHALVEAPPEDVRAAMAPATPSQGRRFWIGDVDARGWVHLVDEDPAGGLVWRPCPRGEPALQRGGRYLVTGGSGALGRALARHLCKAYGARLLLSGRRPRDGDVESLLGDLERLGGEVRYEAADLTSAADRGRLCDRARDLFDELDGVFHLAGGLSPEGLAAKRAGLALLTELTPALGVSFSSISATIPGLDRGIEDYAAANAELDRHARQARLRGDRVVSVAWPPWAGAGLAADAASELARRGIQPISPGRAMAALEWALSSGQPHVVVLQRETAAGAPSLPGDLRGRLREIVAATAEVTVEQIDDHARLAELGIDSLEAMDLVKALEALAGRSLPTTLLYEFDTIDKVVHALEAGAVRETDPVADVSDPDELDSILLPSQQTFVVQREFFPDIPGNVFLACSLTRPDGGPGLQADPLQRALDHLVERHTALRRVIRRDGATWRFVEGGPRPRIHQVERVDDDRLLNEPFDLAAGPLLRVVTDGTRLALNAHHAAVDAWSLRNVMEELLQCHEAIVAGRPPDLPPLGADWPQAAAALRRTGADATDHFGELFADGVPPIHLPWDGPAEAPAEGPVGAYHTVFDPGTTRALEAKARALGVSLPALVLATYLRLLWRSSGQHDLTVRVAHGRREIRVPDAARLVGSFADSLPVRVRLDPAAPFGELARATHHELARTGAHAAASSTALASLLQRGTAGPVGLTPAGFSFPLLPGEPQVGELTMGEVRGASASGFTRLGLIAWVFGGQLHCSWNHTHSHLRPATVRDLADHHRRIVHDVLEPPTPTTMLDQLHGRVLARCRRHPDRTAIETLTYGDLDRQSAALAPRLRGQRVAVLAPPGGEAVVGLLAVLRAGAAYVPLEPTWPDRRIRQVLDRAAPGSLVTTPALAERAGRLAPELPVALTDGTEADDGPLERGELAYVMFTSGSTGRPKGVMVSHRAVLAFHDWVARVFGVTEHDRFVQTSSLAFGGSIRQIWSPLQAGATIHPVPRETVRDPEALVRFIQDHGITIWNSVPSLWTHLLDAAEQVGDAFASVRWVLLGGEVVPAGHVRRWRERYGDRPRLANLYGSTETVVNATWHEVVRTPAPDEVHTPIGRIRAGQEVVVLDEVDGVGELAVGGLVADGYLGEPELTDEAFVEHPSAGRVYRTGDLVRRNADGDLVYLGRSDSQVQIWGNRVELGEVEATLCNHEHVTDAVVVEQDGRLHATVQSRGAEAPQLRAWLGDRLPSWMVPHRLTVTAELPRTAVGKADRLTLRHRAARSTPEAGGPLRRAVAAAWEDVLQLEHPTGPDDDFFALGGDSLPALVVLEKLRERISPVPRPMVLYRHRRLADLVQALRDAGATPLAPDQPPTPPDTDRCEGPAAPAGELPLSPVQRGFWLAHQLRPETPPTWCASMPLRGPLDVRAFERALAWLVVRHPLLRTVYGESFAGPIQRVTEAMPVRPQYDQLEDLPTDVRERALESRWTEEAAARFDLGRGPLFRVRLCRIGPDEHRLMLAAHHIVADAWSAWLLAGEMIAAHDAMAAGDPPALPSPAGSFFDEVTRTGTEDPWWSSYLEDCRQQPAPPRSRTVERELGLDARTWERIERRARSLAVSPFLAVLSALFEALHEVVGDDVVVATALSGRDGREEHIGNVVGPYATALPVRVAGEPTPQRVAASFGEACAHADASPASVVAGADARVLGRFFLSWLDPASAPVAGGGSLRVDWAAGRYRFATQATDTEVMVGALAGDGLQLNVHGGPLVDQVLPRLRGRLERLAVPDAALVVYAPDDVPLPVDRPLVIERIEAASGTSDLVLLPLHASELAACTDLDDRVREAIACTDARVVGLAGMLPTLTGLGTRSLAGPQQLLTTGHAATVVAMVHTLELALRRTGARWTDLVVGALGYGSIGRAVVALARHRLGEPGGLLICDPGHPESVSDLGDADWILGATSGGRTLDVHQLAPGTVVIDDSFPRAFDDRAAIQRMATAMDVLLVGGGMLDAGGLRRTSPFPGADELRDRFGALWLPGCHAETLLVAADPSVGPTRGAVDVSRAAAMWHSARESGFTAAPLHLGGWLVPDELVDRLGVHMRGSSSRREPS